MRDWYSNYLVETRRRKAEIEAAEKYQLIKNSASAHTTVKIHQRLVFALGAKLVQWGTRMQAHYENLYPGPRQGYASEPPC